MSRAASASLASLVALGFAACSGSGLGDAVRKDVSARIESTAPDLSACYKTALEKKRKLRGRMVLGFEIEPKTGQFAKVQVVGDPLGDPDLASCVQDKVSALKLEKPQSTIVSIDSYPIDFEPSE